MKGTIILAGATGLVGGHCLELLLANARCSQVVTIGRRRTGRKHEKLRETVVDLGVLTAADLPPAEAVVCCLGTTRRAAGSAEAFRRVDFDYVERLGRAAKARGIPRFVLVSAMSASPRSRLLYSRTKGEIEEALVDLELGSLEIVRPSLLIGEREERRPMERIFVVAAAWLRFLFRGPLTKYRPVAAREVALALVELAFGSSTGVHAHESDAIPHRI